MDRIVLDAPEASGARRVPVRIFVGTEHAQYRAERVFVWSIEQVRDPGRVYEIYLMKDLPDFDRRRWLTGFTNYRFLIPLLAGEEGRAIYNDIDQIYLSDPAELFDAPMGAHGYLSINPRDTSVMLIDCARMARVWTADLARRERRKAIEARAAEVPGLWGELPGVWNARDLEYEAGRSRCVHFTTIHTQPWMPFPLRFVYQQNPVGYLWHDLERSADECGFELFASARPSAQYLALLDRLREGPVSPTPASAEERADLAEALAARGADSVLEMGWGSLDSESPAESLCDGSGARSVTRHDPACAALDKPPRGSFDAVVCAGGLERLDDDDVGWAVERLFALARRFVYARVGEDARAPSGARWRAGVPRDRFWWSRCFEAAARRHPGIDWQLVGHAGEGDARHVRWRRRRGHRAGAPPRVWVLEDDKPGHTVQSEGLARALGWPYEVRELRFHPGNRLSNRLLGASVLGLRVSASDPLRPPWPDLVIATGRRLAPVARWIAAQSGGHTRTVQLGRKGGDLADAFDLVVTCAHFRLLPHRRRLETLLPLHAIDDARLAEAAARWRVLAPDSDAAPVVLLVGGTSARHRLDAEAAGRLGREVSAFAAAAGRRVLAVTSPRTGAAACEALAASLAQGSTLYRWKSGDPENPYLGALALGCAIVVTGDSESMLGEACAAGKPVYVYPLPERPLGLRHRLAEWVIARAHARPRKRGKGSVRPQQGLERLFARLLAWGAVRIPRDMAALHRALVERGAARMFGAPFECAPTTPLREVDDLAARVRGMLGAPERWSPAAARPAGPACRVDRVPLVAARAAAGGDA